MNSRLLILSLVFFSCTFTKKEYKRSDVQIKIFRPYCDFDHYPESFQKIRKIYQSILDSVNMNLPLCGISGDEKILKLHQMIKSYTYPMDSNFYKDFRSYAIQKASNCDSLYEHARLFDLSTVEVFYKTAIEHKCWNQIYFQNLEIMSPYNPNKMINKDLINPSNLPVEISYWLGFIKFDSLKKINLNFNQINFLSKFGDSIALNYIIKNYVCLNDTINQYYNSNFKNDYFIRNTYSINEYDNPTRVEDYDYFNMTLNVFENFLNQTPAILEKGVDFKKWNLRENNIGFTRVIVEDSNYNNCKNFVKNTYLENLNFDLCKCFDQRDTYKQQINRYHTKILRK